MATRVAVLGAGGIGLGVAAQAASAGAAVSIWSPTLARDSGGRTAAIEARDGIEGAFDVAAAPSVAAAVADAGLVVIAVPAWAHRGVIEALVPALGDGHTVFFSAHYGFAALHLVRLIAARGLSVPVAASATTILTARRQAPTKVRVMAVRARVETGVIPAAAAPAAAGLCRAAFGDRFHVYPDATAVFFANPNPTAHVATALCNLTRIERGEAWANYDMMTAGVSRLMEALDAEKRDVAAAFGVAVRPLNEHIADSFGVPLGAIAEQARTLHARRGGPPGPTSLDTRYVIEDVPYGAMAIVRLGRIAGIHAVLHEAAVAIFSAIYGRAFRDEDGLAARALEHIPDAGALRAFVAGGNGAMIDPPPHPPGPDGPGPSRSAPRGGEGRGEVGEAMS